MTVTTICSRWALSVEWHPACPSHFPMHLMLDTFPIPEAQSTSAILRRMDAAAVPDETLMRRYVAGDVAAFEALYSRHESALWRYLVRCSGHRAEADELMQEVWFSVAREAPGFDPSRQFTTWLYAIARHRSIDRHRSARRTESLDAAEHIADPGSPSPAQEAERAEEGHAILVALAKLPPEQREAFVLQADSGLSVEDIATVTGTSFETAKSRLRYARDKLKALLRDYA